MLEKMKKRIVIADDNSAWCNILKKYLKQNTEFEVVGTTEDGEEQISMIKNLKPDIVITDIKRESGISGIEVIKRCNELNLEQTKFLVETASCSIDERMLLNNLGIKNILLKPFSLNEIIKKLEEVY